MEEPSVDAFEQIYDLDTIIYKDYEEIELKGSYFEDTLCKISI